MSGKATHTIGNVETSELRLRSTTTDLLNVTSSSSMSSSIPFVFPPDLGGTGYFMRTDGSGNTQWVNPADSESQYPPYPNDDNYRCLTNELINISVLDNDIKGGSLLAPNLDISINSSTTPTQGTLTNTGSGTYTYRSFPRYLGVDRFSYDIIDTSSTVSYNSATVFISVENIDPVGSTGPHFIYGRKSDSIVRLYKNGVVTDLFTATYPGAAGSPSGINCLAVNRDDNLIYYTAHSASSSDDTRIYAYDYANPSDNTQFQLGNFSSFASTFNGSSAVYNQGKLYIPTTTSQGDTYVVIALDAYYITAGPVGNQSWTAATSRFTSTDIAVTSMAWDYHGGNLVVSGIQSGNPRTSIIDPLTGNTLRTYSFSSGSQEVYITASYNLSHYIGRDGSNSLNSISLYDGTIGTGQPNLAHTDVSDFGEWIVELQSV